MDIGASIVIMTVIRFLSISDYDIDAQVLSSRYQRLKYCVNFLLQKDLMNIQLCLDW